MLTESTKAKIFDAIFRKSIEAISTPTCKICEQQIPEDSYKLVEMAQDYGEVYYIICNWCAQLVKETFEKE